MLRNVAAKGARMSKASSTVFGLALVIALILVSAGCGSEERAQNDTAGTNESARSSSEKTGKGPEVNVTAEGAEVQLSITTTEANEGAQALTPIVGQVPYAPIPFAGSDGRTHLVYELETTNFSSN